MLGENLQSIRENAETFIKASMDTCSEGNSEKTNYVQISPPKGNRIRNIVIRSSSFADVKS